MRISVTEPIEQALTSTKGILFAPFDATKWLKLGFCAFLGQLGYEASGGGSHWEPSSTPTADNSLQWLRDNLDVVITTALAVIPILLAVSLLVLALESRGRFMFFDGVVHNRGAVVEPWKEFRKEANSALLFKLAIGGVTFLVVVAISVLGYFLASADIESGIAKQATWTALIVCGGLLSLVSFATLILDTLLNDFVVPAMYKRRIGVMEGWSVVKNEFLAPHLGAIVLYFLMRLLFVLIAQALVFGLICITACFATLFLLIPYVSTVVLLPIYVFTRNYSMHFLQQFGPTWEFRSEHPSVDSEPL